VAVNNAAARWRSTVSKATHFSFDPTEFAGKRALVTGGTQGMGEAIMRLAEKAGTDEAAALRGLMDSL
jgi:hypothetical protein